MTPNPWSAMDTDDGVHDGKQSRGKTRSRPWEDDSDDDPESGYRTASDDDPRSKQVGAFSLAVINLTCQSQSQDWIRTKVRIKEADYSSELRDHLQQSEGALAEALKKNQELEVRILKATHLRLLMLYTGHE